MPCARRWSGCAHDPGPHSRRHRRLRRRALPRLLRADHAPDPALLGPDGAIDPVQPGTPRRARLHHRGRGPLPQRVPPRDPAPRAVRPQPDPRDPPAARGRGDRRRRAPRVSGGLAGAAARGWCRALAVAGTIVALDQGAKSAVLQSLGPHERVQAIPGFHLVLVGNKGIAFGFLGDGGAAVVAVTAIALGLVLAWFA